MLQQKVVNKWKAKSFVGMWGFKWEREAGTRSKEPKLIVFIILAVKHDVKESEH